MKDYTNHCSFLNNNFQLISLSYHIDESHCKGFPVYDTFAM